MFLKYDHLDRVEAAASGLRVRVAQRRARLLAQGAVLVVALPSGAAVAIGAVLHAGVDGAGDGAAIRSADLFRETTHAIVEIKGGRAGERARKKTRC